MTHLFSSIYNNQIVKKLILFLNITFNIILIFKCFLQDLHQILRTYFKPNFLIQIFIFFNDFGALFSEIQTNFIAMKSHAERYLIHKKYLILKMQIL